MDNIIRIFADGACRGNGKEENIGAYGIYLQFGEYEKELYQGYKNTTNNKMEILSVIVALEQLKVKDLPIIVHSDSAYVVNCMNEKWYKGWQKNGWKNSKKELVANRDLWEKLIALIESFTDIKFYKVKGHVDTYNGLKMEEEYKKFVKSNNFEIERGDFILVVEGNNKADKLANKGMDEIE